MAISKVEIRNSDGTKNVLVDLTGDTVSADTLTEGITAHGADGEEITGTLHKTTGIIYNADSVEFKDWSSSPDVIRIKKAITEDAIFKTGGSGISIDAKASEFGDATAEDVISGKTFTSSAGLKVAGTAERMLKKTGTVEISEDSSTIKVETGLNTIDAIVVYKASVNNSTFFWVYSDVIKALAYANTSNKLLSTSTTFYTSGGTITCNNHLSGYPVKAGTYKWVAFGS